MNSENTRVKIETGVYDGVVLVQLLFLIFCLCGVKWWCQLESQASMRAKISI